MRHELHRAGQLAGSEMSIEQIDRIASTTWSDAVGGGYRWVYKGSPSESGRKTTVRTRETS